MFKDLPSGETHCNLFADAKQRTLDLYKPPFRVQIIFEALTEAVDSTGKVFVKYNQGELIAEALNEYYANHKEK